MLWDSYKQFTKPRYFLRLQGWYDSEMQKRMIWIRASFGGEMGIKAWFRTVHNLSKTSDNSKWWMTYLRDQRISNQESSRHFSLLSALFGNIVQHVLKRMTSRFANVQFAKILYYVLLLKRRNKRFACTYIYLVLSAMIQKSEIHLYIPRSFSHLSGESS